MREDGQPIMGIGERWIMARYDPLTDDAQCLALVKRLPLNLFAYASDGPQGPDFRAICPWRDAAGVLHEFSAWSKSLNRAVVECVAKLQKQELMAGGVDATSK